MGGQPPSFPPEVLEGFAGYSESHITWLLFVLHLNTFILIKCGKIPLGLGLKGKRLIFFSAVLFLDRKQKRSSECCSGFGLINS